MIYCRFFVFILISASLASCAETVLTVTPQPVPSETWDENSPSILTLTSNTVNWRHWNYELKPDNSVSNPFASPRTQQNKQFPVLVIDNIYLTVTVLPDYGGRILSVYYKPTGHEQLYQNPIGTPYGNGAGNFYYNWLMVYGGIFPTFPEPEHGKTWLLPWLWTVSAQTDEKIAIQMSITDTVHFAGRPGQFNNGLTGISCQATVTVYRDRPIIELHVALKNNQGVAINYEYWTCTTLAPGSTPGDTKTPARSLMAVPVNRIILKDDWWPWMATAETPIDAPNHIFEYKNLALFQNWQNMGIGYGVNLTNDWWGVINLDNAEGFLRIADNKNMTPGIKFWTWGFSQSYAANPQTDPLAEARPYIELWGGHSLQFFTDAIFPANGTKSWTETYVTTVGLTNVSWANTNAALELSGAVTNGTLGVTATVFTYYPGTNITYEMLLQGASDYALTNGSFRSRADQSRVIAFTAPSGNYTSGSYRLILRLSNETMGMLANYSNTISL